MDFYGLGAGLFVGAFGGAVAAILIRMYGARLDEARLDSLDNRYNNLRLKLQSASGVEARQANAERMNAAIAEAAQIYAANKDNPDVLKKELLELLAKYPDVSLKLLQRALNGKLNLGGLFK